MSTRSFIRSNRLSATQTPTFEFHLLAAIASLRYSLSFKSRNYHARIFLRSTGSGCCLHGNDEPPWAYERISRAVALRSCFLWHVWRVCWKWYVILISISVPISIGVRPLITSRYQPSLYATIWYVTPYLTCPPKSKPTDKQQILTPPATEPHQTHLEAPACSTPRLPEAGALNTHHSLLTLPLTLLVPRTALPATEPHRTRLEAAACSILLLRHQDHLKAPPTLHALLTLLLPLPARALTRATTPPSRI
jgi:hypothetical protein